MAATSTLVKRSDDPFASPTVSGITGAQTAAGGATTATQLAQVSNAAAVSGISQSDSLTGSVVTVPTTFTSTSASTSSGQPSPSASPKNQKAPSVAAVAGGAVGGVVVLAVIILAIFLILRRRRLQSRSRQNIPVSPSVEFPATPKEQLVNRQTFGEEKGSLFAGIDADPPGMP
ncbi:hypothetical protein GYMLUDRAFT_263904, partial [Collybiopsis luxurians FD-317 M1]